MCSGRVDLAFVLRAFLNGVDGVLIGGCRLDECNYVTHGNYDARNMVLLCQKIMAHIGLNPERLRVEFMSSGDGFRFTEVVDAFVDTVNRLGPLGRSEGLDETERKNRLREMIKLVPYIKLEKKDKLATRRRDREVLETLFTREEIDVLVREVVSYHIDPDLCQACMICLRRCPVDAIVGGKKRIHVIDQDQCIKCGTCYEACPPRFGAVKKVSGGPVPPPIPEEERVVARAGKK